MRAWFGLSVALIVSAGAGCFDPKLGGQPFACGNGPSHDCPPGYQCDLSLGDNGECVRGQAVDALTPMPDAPPGTPDAASADARGPLADANIIFVDGAPGQPDASCEQGSFLGCSSSTTADFCGFQVGCPFQCSEVLRGCTECDPSKTACQLDSLITCDDLGTITHTTSCPLGCNAEKSRCYILAPANIGISACDPLSGAGPSLRVQDSVQFDTTVCQDSAGNNGRLVSQSSGAPSVCVIDYFDFKIDATGVITAAGNNALAIVIHDSGIIEGTIDVSANSVLDGPGVAPALVPGPLDATSGSGGGGGAGFATAGGAGGDIDLMVAGGPVRGSDTDSPLLAGGHGGRGASCSILCPSPAQGGGGGGALQLVACNNLSIAETAILDAGGGGGAGGGTTTVLGQFGAGGGGSGGSILIEAPAVTVPVGAIVVANGGGGGAGSTSDNGAPGSDGLRSAGAAPGGPTNGSGGGGSGGTSNGMTGAEPGTGGPATTDIGGGGGGGAAGRIRINVSPNTLPTQNGSIISPKASVGQVNTR